MPVKIMQLLKFPAVNRSNWAGSVYSAEEKPDIADFPAGRKPSNGAVQVKERNLTSNMTGQITLTGASLDLHFNKGSLRRINSNGTILFDKLNSRTRFATSSGNIKFRNESAFAFEDNREYGLRTLQIPENKKIREYRLITDFIQNRESNELFLTFAVNYPEFEKNTIIFESAVCELKIPFKSESGVEIISDSQSSGNLLIKDDPDDNIFIPGRSFTIKTSCGNLSIVYTDPSELPELYDSENFSTISGLSVKNRTQKGKHVLYINPGGSYTPAPAEYYSGISEKFSFKLDVTSG